MRLGTISLSDQRLTVASHDGIVAHDISEFAGTGGLPGLLGSMDLLDITSLNLDAYPVVDVIRARWLPPVPKPDRIICVGLNFRTHAAEVLADVAEHPTLFVRFPSTFVGHGEALIRPEASDTLDWEGEVALVIGQGGRNIPAARALQHVAGYAPMGENSIREWQLHTRQATAGKNFDDSGSWGPWLITGDEIPDPSVLEVVTELNGEQVQHGRLSDLIFSVPDIIAYVSTFTELAPGDVIATGTPAGIGHRQDPPRYLRSTDLLTIRIPGFAELSNTVADEKAEVLQ